MQQLTTPGGPAASLDQPVRSRAAPPSSSARVAAYLSLAATGLFLVLLAALHVLKPELDPAWRMVSEYALGRYGWLMQLAFFSMALSSASACVAVWSQVRARAGRLGLVLLLVAAAALLLGGVFVIDPVTARPEALTLHGQLHGLAAMMGNPAFAVAALLVSVGLARNPAWASARRALLWTAQLPWLSLVWMLATLAITLGQSGGVFGPEVVIGWPNRVLVVAYGVWLATVAWHALRLSQPTAQAVQ
jgi:hypothetical protein